MSWVKMYISSDLQKKNVDDIKIKMVEEQNKDDGLDSPTNRHEF